MKVWGYRVVAMRAVQYQSNSVKTWTAWKSCMVDSPVLGEAFGAVGSKVGEAENNQSYC